MRVARRLVYARPYEIPIKLQIYEQFLFHSIRLVEKNPIFLARTGLRPEAYSHDIIHCETESLPLSSHRSRDN